MSDPSRPPDGGGDPPPENPCLHKASNPQPHTKPAEQPMCSYWKLYSYADRWDMLLLLGGLIGSLGGGIMLPLFSIFFGQFADTFGDPSSNDNFMQDVSDIALKFTYTSIAAFVGMYLEVTCFVLAGERQTMRLRKAYLNSVLAQDVAFFDTQATTGGLLQGLNDDGSAVQLAISDRAGQFIHHTTTIVAGFIIAFTYGWDVTLVMLGCMPFMGMMGAGAFMFAAKGQEKQSAAYAKASGIAQQTLANVRTVAAFNGAESALRSYEGALEAPMKVGAKVQGLVGVSIGGMQAVMYCSSAASFFYGAYRIVAGKYTGGDVVLVQLSAMMASFALAQAAPVLPQLAAGRIAGYRMFQVIERKPAHKDMGTSLQPNAPPTSAAAAAVAAGGKGVSEESGAAGPAPAAAVGQLAHVEGRLELRDVHFAYPARPDVPVFRGFSLVVPAGHTVALVGASGSGKSTAVQLIERFYDPDSGAVLLDGVDLRALSMQWLRMQIGLVAQEPTLFATTIYENIAIGRPGASKQEVEEAAKAANAHKFIHLLPEGYSTQVGERGVQLSGGQKQRIAIARAILKNPKVLLLDEATSALDTQSERVVQAALDRMVVGRTTVVVAHRLSTIQHAHAIAVVSSGQVVELGSHSQLLANPNGAYAVLVQMQMQLQAQQQEPENLVEGSSVQEEQGVPEEGEEGEQAGSAKPPTTPSPFSTHPLVNAPPAAVPPVEPRTQGKLSLSGISDKATSLDGTAAVPRSSRGPASQQNSLSQVVVAPDSRTSRNGAEKVAAVKKTAKQLEEEQQRADEEAAKAVPFTRLLRLNKPEWPALVAGCLGSAAAGAQNPAMAFVFADMISMFFLTDMDELKRQASFYAWMFFVIACGALAATSLQQACLGWAGSRLAQRIRVMLMGSLMRQEVAFFDDDKNSSGRLTSALATDAAYIRGAVGDAVGLLLQNLSTLAAGYAIAFVFNWQMALLVTGTFPIILLAGVLQMRFAMGSSSKSDELYGGANQYISEAFSNIRIIKAFNLQAYISGKYTTLLDSTRPTVRRQANIGGLGMGFSFCSIFAMYALIIYFGGWQVENDKTDLNGMLKGFLAILMAAMGMAQAGVSFPDLGKAKGAVGRVFPLLDRQPLIDPDAPGDTKPEEQVQGALAFQAIKFVYPSRPTVIIYNQFSLTIPAGKVHALVGESGSGKSTVVALLERFYDPLEGSILLDGVDIKHYNLKWLRQQMGLVSQEPILFAGTVADNIKYGMPGASLEQVEAAARIANAHEFVMKLPEGYSTVVGEGGGIQLSGGQKQRIAIARAVVKNPRVLLLDEATSALDARSERVVQDALDSVMHGRTCLVIAHRLSTIKNADAINVLYKGSILEQGTHAELMAKPDGAYAKLVRAQQTAHHA